MKQTIFATLATAVLCSAGVFAQQQQPSRVANQNSSQVADSDSQDTDQYLLGPGDVLEVRIFGQPDLSATVALDSNGNITSLHFIEKPVPAKCRTEAEVQKLITEAYTTVLKEPRVSVRLIERNSRQHATVFGAVRQTAKVPTIRRIRLNELLATTGGFSERAAGTIQIVHTEPIMCPRPGEEAQGAPLDGTNLPFRVIKISDLRAGKPHANPVIRPGDYIFVTEAEQVYITGSVVSPGSIYLTDQLTLTKALAMVGGPRKEAKISDVRIYRHKPGSLVEDTIRVDLAAIRKNQVKDVLLEPFDVIEVNEAGLLSKERWADTVLQAVTGGFLNVFTSGRVPVPH
jgi:polysaccharide export outer membrane protein